MRRPQNRFIDELDARKKRFLQTATTLTNHSDGNSPKEKMKCKLAEGLRDGENVGKISYKEMINSKSLNAFIQEEEPKTAS